jgi:hypothetical protein
MGFLKDALYFAMLAIISVIAAAFVMWLLEQNGWINP